MYWASAWNIMGGYTGLFSLGNGIFLGLGAYITGILFVFYGVTPYIGMLIAGLLTGLFAVLIGYPTFKIKSIYYALATFSLLALLKIVFSSMHVVLGFETGGSDGFKVPTSNMLPQNMQFMSKLPYYYIALGLLIIILLVSNYINKSKSGYYFRSISTNAGAASSLGVSVTGYKMRAQFISAFFTAVGGGFYSIYVAYIDPSTVFGAGMSFDILSMCIIGGSNTLFGPVLGAGLMNLINRFVKIYFASRLVGMASVVSALILMLVVFFIPQGIFKTLRGVWDKYKKKQVLKKDFGTSDKMVGFVEESMTSTENNKDNVQEEKKPVDLKASKAYATDKIILEGKNITKRFGGLVAVKNIDIHLKQNEILGLIGTNGAGKTTLFNMISGTLSMTEGELNYHGKTIHNPQAHKMTKIGIGRTYQICQPFSNMTVIENVMVGAYLNNTNTEQVREKAHEVLKRVHLDHRSDVLGNSLTLPELKRMELARALATEPDILLLDEVIAGLNPTETEKIMKLILEIRDSNISIIIIEHVMRAIMNLSDRIIVMNQGEKIAEGLPSEIASNQLVIESYLGGDASA
jgi:branched-chain amino acid transport system permease protein